MVLIFFYFPVKVAGSHTHSSRGKPPAPGPRLLMTALDRDGGNESVDDSDCGNVAQENDDDNDEDDANDRNFRVGSFGSGYMIQ